MSDSLLSKQLLLHKKYQEGKKLLLEALQEVTDKIQFQQQNPTTPLDPEDLYAKLLQELGNHRGAPPFYPYIGSGIGRGPLVELLDGSIKYDMITGIGPNIFGHSHVEIVEASLIGAMSDTVMQGNLLPNEDAVTLMKLLKEHSGLARCILSSSGAMACENALKIIFQKKFPASRLLAFEHCFMGRTLALSQITDKPVYRQGLPTTLYVDYLPFYDESLSMNENIAHLLQAAQNHIKRYPGQHACCCIELVQGEGGILAAPRAFFTQLIEYLKAHNILIFIDEVQTFARTESLFAFQSFDLGAFVDIVTIGKISQVCATLFKEELTPQPGLISQTFTASSTAIKTALWLLQKGAKQLFGNGGKNRVLGDYFREKLTALNQEIPGACQPPYGLGALLAFTPFTWNHEQVVLFLKKLFKNGIIAFTAGTSPTRVRFLPPFGCMEKEDVDALIPILTATIKETLKEIENAQ